MGTVGRCLEKLLPNGYYAEKMKGYFSEMDLL